MKSDFDINAFIIDDDSNSLFEDALGNCIREWQESGKDPVRYSGELRTDANELMAVALNPIPCWNKVKACLGQFTNGIYETPMGKALVHDGYFVMLQDLVSWLPRTIDK